MKYPRCYIADGCGGDEVCVALCPNVARPTSDDVTPDEPTIVMPPLGDRDYAHRRPE